ncbi:hypothetical protein [Novilysobacter selenitireducens]|uniref:Secreted protein n=1 Tax=Novilysobacter selenitireducens TaxID=2872639 RepID=A0ABS7T5Z1_9GAMM|nr:hypothetical protein [Lysobacter selenitireducens]MBZ4039296.1 hypothetical protein [Lysobacter selenitireducens]
MKTAFLLFAMSIACVAHAGDRPEASAAPAAETTQAGDDAGLVCERKKETGSNRVTRVCTTEAERIAAKDKAQDDVQRLGRCSGNDIACIGEF